MTDYATSKQFDKFSIKLFKHFDKRFDGMEESFEGLRAEFRQLQTAVDAYAKQVEIYHQESIARDAKVDRLERWIGQVAHKTGVKLEY